MDELLEGKRLFVDTAESSDADFNMQNPSFVELAKPCKGKQMVLLTTDITRREIDSGVRVHAENTVLK